MECFSHGMLLFFPGVCLEKGKNTLYFCYSVMRSCRQEVFGFQPEPFSSIPVLFICGILSSKAPSLLHLTFLPQKDRLWDRHKGPGGYSSIFTFSSCSLLPSICKTQQCLNIQNPPFFNVNRSLWSLTFYLPYSKKHAARKFPSRTQVQLVGFWYPRVSKSIHPLSQD